jgi:hypothetical protein
MRRPAGVACQKTDFKQIRLDNIHQGVGFFVQSRGERFDSDWAAFVNVFDDVHHGVVESVEGRFVNAFELHSVARDFRCDVAVGAHLSEVAHSRSRRLATRGVPRLRRAISARLRRQPACQNVRAATHNGNQIFFLVKIEMLCKPKRSRRGRVSIAGRVVAPMMVNFSRRIGSGLEYMPCRA